MDVLGQIDNVFFPKLGELARVDVARFRARFEDVAATRVLKASGRNGIFVDPLGEEKDAYRIWWSGAKKFEEAVNLNRSKGGRGLGRNAKADVSGTRLLQDDEWSPMESRIAFVCCCVSSAINKGQLLAGLEKFR